VAALAVGGPAVSLHTGAADRACDPPLRVSPGPSLTLGRVGWCQLTRPVTRCRPGSHTVSRRPLSKYISSTSRPVCPTCRRDLSESDRELGVNTVRSRHTHTRGSGYVLFASLIPNTTQCKVDLAVQASVAVARASPRCRGLIGITAAGDRGGGAALLRRAAAAAGRGGAGGRELHRHRRRDGRPRRGAPRPLPRQHQDQQVRPRYMITIITIITSRNDFSGGLLRVGSAGSATHTPAFRLSPPPGAHCRRSAGGARRRTRRFIWHGRTAS
jgi:hypothetical protein